MTTQTISHVLISFGMMTSLVGMALLFWRMVRYEWQRDFGANAVPDGTDTEQVG